jgi:hypothetical protein
MANDAGVSIYAVKDIRRTALMRTWVRVYRGQTLGANHDPRAAGGSTASATLKRLGDWALKHKMSAAHYASTGQHDRLRRGFAVSKGKWRTTRPLRGGDQPGDAVDFLNKFHDRISSFHLKDRTTVQHCALNLAWGMGETPIKEILKLVEKNVREVPRRAGIRHSEVPTP